MEHGGYTFARTSLEEILKLGKDAGVQFTTTPNEYHKYLAGKDTDGSFRVPAADGLSELHFRGRDLLSRFTSMPTPSQENLLRSIRETMRAGNSHVLHLENAPFGARGRTLKIQDHSCTDKYDGPLFFELV